MSTSTVGSTTSPKAAMPASLGQLWQVPVFLLGLLGLAIVTAVSPLAARVDVDSFDSDLLTIRKVLEQRGVWSPDTLALAENVVGRVARQPERAGEAHYLLGAVFLRQAEKSTGKSANEEREKAGLHLELAALRGVPPKDSARLTYLRGKLAFQNKNMAKAIEHFSASLPAGADNASEGFGLLVQAHLVGASPNIEAALAANLKQMESCEDEQTLTKARMQRGELLFRDGKRIDAINVLDVIGSKASPDIRLKARLYQATAAMEEGLWGRAAGWWNELVAHPDAVPGGKGRILYNLGVCWLNFEPPLHISKAEAAWQEAKAYGGEEAQAAAMRLGALKLRSSQGVQAALPLFKEALAKVTTLTDYKNSLLDLGTARGLLQEACQVFHQSRDSESFLQAAELYKKLAPAGDAEELVGQAAERSAQDLLEKAMQLGPREGDTLAVQARDCFQKAALAYEHAAENRKPEARVDVLWRSIECYRLSNKIPEAVAVLQRFVDLPASAERKAEAWFTLAEIQRGFNSAAAKECYKRCVAYDSPTFTARARLQLAELLLADHNLAEAEAVLKQVVSPLGSRPIEDHVAHEAGLLKLANLYYQQRQYEKAALRYKELVKLYSSNPGAAAIRDQLGQCYLKIAEHARAEKKKADDEGGGVLPQRIANLVQEEESNLESARDIFQQNADDLDARARALKSDGKALSAADATLHRRAHLGIAICYFDVLERVKEAFPSELPRKLMESSAKYNTVFDRFPTTAEALIACKGLVFCVGTASDMRHPQLGVMIEAAQTAVDHCQINFGEYERAGAFPVVDKEKWQTWLSEVRVELQKLKLRVQSGKGI